MSSKHSSNVRVSLGCVGSPSFDPAKSLHDQETHARAVCLLEDDNRFDEAIRTWFRIPEGKDGDGDGYVYRAVAEVTLGFVQKVIENDMNTRRTELLAEGEGGCTSRWYKAPEGEHTPSPTAPDVTSYINIFLPTTNTSSALKTFQANARKSSVRQHVATHLVAKRFFLPSHPLTKDLSNIPRCKQSPVLNPALDFWAWSCQLLGWCGPLGEEEDQSTLPGADDRDKRDEAIDLSPGQATRRWQMWKGSHPILPVMMHHFGCAVPSHEGLMIVKILAEGGSGGGAGGGKNKTKGEEAAKTQRPNKNKKRKVVDMGSGNGYWTMMLRGYGVEVDAVDNGMSKWRTTWIPDTLIQTGTGYLASHPDHDSLILLLVYPVVGGKLTGTAEGSFTRDLVAAYKGDTLVVVGTQNHNGYTGFPDMTMDEFMEREHSGEWVRTVQVAMPSFAGKDEALFVFQRVPALGDDGSLR